METQNVMIVTVNYTFSSFTLTSTRFTYEDFDGTKHIDRKMFRKNGEEVLERVAKYLRDDRGMNIVGCDNSASGKTYVVIAPSEDGFKSVSGNFEKRND